MAFFSTKTYRYFAVALFLICCAFQCNSQNPAEENPFQVRGEDPAQVVANALLCFNHRMIYARCQESYRLTEKGTINVPHKETDEYCNGPCLSETKLVLDCIDGILSNYLFYNKATVQDVRTTIDAACSDTSERGNFDVPSHIENEYSHAHQIRSSTYTHVFMAMVIGGGLFF